MPSSIEKITINEATIFVEVYDSHVILYSPAKSGYHARIHRFKFKRTPSSGWVIQGGPLWDFLNRVNLRERDLKKLDRKLDEMLKVKIFSIFEEE